MYYKQKKNVYARDDNNSSDEDDSDSQEVLFLAMCSKHEPFDDENQDHEDLNNEAKVDFEGDFMCA